MLKIENGFSVPVLFLLKMLLIMLLIYVLAVLTPKLAARVDAFLKKRNKNSTPEDERLYQVRSAFEPRPDDEKPNKALFPEIQEIEKNKKN